MVWICHIHDLDHQIDDQEHDTKRLVTRSRSFGVSIMCHMYLCTGTGTSNSTEHGRRTDAPYYQPPARGCGVYGVCVLKTMSTISIYQSPISSRDEIGTRYRVEVRSLYIMHHGLHVQSSSASYDALLGVPWYSWCMVLDYPHQQRYGDSPPLECGRS